MIDLLFAHLHAADAANLRSTLESLILEATAGRTLHARVCQAQLIRSAGIQGEANTITDEALAQYQQAMLSDLHNKKQAMTKQPTHEPSADHRTRWTAAVRANAAKQLRAKIIAMIGGP